MTHLDLGALYDTVLTAAEGVARAISPDDMAGVKGLVKLANDALGMDLRKDLLDALGDRFVQYQAPSEGPFTLGRTVLFKVKDAAKARDGVEQLVKAVARLTGVEVRVKKRTYRGAEVREVHVKMPGFVVVPTFTVHKGWLAIGLFPQAVHGYVLRADGLRTAWKPSARVRGSFDKLPKEFLSVSYSDPRPTLTQLLAVAPLIGAAVNAFSPESDFAVGSLPNAQEASEFLFPNVAVSSDDGKVFRLESRSSLSLPLDITGLDTYAILLLYGNSLRFFL
jgi:hypothetical protein